MSELIVNRPLQPGDVLQTRERAVMASEPPSMAVPNCRCVVVRLTVDEVITRSWRDGQGIRSTVKSCAHAGYEIAADYVQQAFARLANRGHLG